jgi:hypothetical protein
MSDYDFIQLYKKLDVLDRELKELRAEVSQIKVYNPLNWKQSDVDQFNDRPPQWPNESYTDYLKRIGQ